MKNLSPLWLISLSGIALLISCTKPSNTTNSNNTGPFISALVNGTSVTATTVAAAYANGVLQAEGGISLTSSLEIATDSTAPGNYPVTSAGINGFEYFKNSNTAYKSSSGAVVITSFANKIVIGTFSGWAKNVTGGSDSVNITKGAFNIKLQ